MFKWHSTNKEKDEHLRFFLKYSSFCKILAPFKHSFGDRDFFHQRIFDKLRRAWKSTRPQHDSRARTSQKSEKSNGRLMRKDCFLISPKRSLLLSEALPRERFLGLGKCLSEGARNDYHFTSDFYSLRSFGDKTSSEQRWARVEFHAREIFIKIPWWKKSRAPKHGLNGAGILQTVIFLHFQFCFGGRAPHGLPI